MRPGNPPIIKLNKASRARAVAVAIAIGLTEGPGERPKGLGERLKGPPGAGDTLKQSAPQVPEVVWAADWVPPTSR